MNMRSESDEAKVSARYPVDLLEAFDALFPLAGYATRQECLREIMRRFVYEQGPKQVAIIEKSRKLA